MTTLSPIQPWYGRIFRHKYEAPLHVLVWVVYLMLAATPWYLGGVDPEPEVKTYFFLTILLYVPGIFYLNTFYLIPVFLQKRQWVRYLFWLLALTALFAAVDAIVAYFYRGGFDTGLAGFITVLWEKLKTGLAGLVFITVFSFAYRFTVDWIVHLGMIEKLETEQYAMELAVLKSQVDPHFLFNTLNSLYALALEEESDKTADGIAKLGTLMRYNLHDAQADTISLQKEVDYLEKYIALQQLRAGVNNIVDVVLDIPEGEAAQIRVSPMLLVPFVENAFKYGTSPVLPAQITIQLGVADGVLRLFVENTIIPQSSIARSGIGLTNVRERLQLLYPNKHILEVGAVDETFTVNLSITLK
ncbi:MAG: histidine kinase [Bacteroidota bacterium]